MINPSTEEDLRETPKRPFGVYMIVLLLVVGMFSAVLEIIRLRTGLTGVWVVADALLLDFSGLVLLATRLVSNPSILTAVHVLIIVAWAILIIGLWFLRRWAWLSSMVFAGIALTFALFRYFEGDPNYFGMLSNVAAAFYLNDRSVRRAYAHRTHEATS